MLAPWVVDEMKDADLRDKRLNNRLKRILSDLSERPTASIPLACGGKAETEAAYRFFDNEKVLPQRVLNPHYQQTKQRIAAQEVAILVPDTTELDLTRPHSRVEGDGPLDDGSRRGALVHLLEAFSEDGTPLGTVWSQMWTRDEPAAEPAADQAEAIASKSQSRRKRAIAGWKANGKPAPWPRRYQGRSASSRLTASRTSMRS